MTLEYLGTPAEVDRPRSRRVPALIALGMLVLVAAVGLALRWSDATRLSAQDRLEESFAESVRIAQTGERSVQGALAYASPMIWSASVSEEVRDGLRGIVEASAADVVADLVAVRETAAGTLVLPWHESALEAREQVVRLIDSQAERFAGIARDARDIDRVLADGPIPTGAAEAALARASAGGAVDPR